MNFWTGPAEFSGTLFHHCNLWYKESKKIQCPSSVLGVLSWCCVLWCLSWVPEAEGVSKPKQLARQVRSKRALACTWQSNVAFLASVTCVLGLFLPAAARNDAFLQKWLHVAAASLQQCRCILCWFLELFFFLKKIFALFFVCFVMVLDFCFCTRSIALTAVRACELSVFIITNFKCVFIQNLQLIGWWDCWLHAHSCALNT